MQQLIQKDQLVRIKHLEQSEINYGIKIGDLYKIVKPYNTHPQDKSSVECIRVYEDSKLPVNANIEKFNTSQLYLDETNNNFH